MPNRNRCEIIGHLGADPDLKYSASGTAFCKFSIGVSEGKDEQRTTTWFRCVAFKEIAEEVADRFHKGDAIGVCGPVKLEEWDDKEGKHRANLAVTAFEVFAPVWRKRESAGNSRGGQHSPAKQGGKAKPDDEIPF